MRPYKRIRVFPERDLRATRLELAVIDCRAVQRLRDIKQLGQSTVSFPTAEHSRFSHSLGALYWSAKMISYLRENDFSEGERGNRALLEKANSTLKQTVLAGYGGEELFGYPIPWFEQLIRLAALLHDISHLPFGHTLEDQAGLLPRHDEDSERIEYLYANLYSELEDSPHLKGTSSPQLSEILSQLLKLCTAFPAIGVILKEQSGLKLVKGEERQRAEEVIKTIDERLLPYLTLVYDIVNNTICADLIDYLHRDSLQCGMPWTLDKALFSNLKILQRSAPYNPSYYRFGVAVSRNGKLRHDVVTAVLGLLRARYDVTEKVYYHHTKCAADAMLEKAVRSGKITLSWKAILDEDLGDEGMIRYLVNSLKGDPDSSAILKALRSRRFFKPVYRLRKGDWSRKTAAAVEQCKTPAGRKNMETKIAEMCKIPESAVIVSCLPEKMQLKEAHALVEWTDGEVITLAELPTRKGYLAEVENLTRRYLELWSLTVYVDQPRENYASSIEKACDSAFGHKNDPLIADYIRAKYPTIFEAREILDSFSQATEVDLIPDLNVAFRGGNPENERNIKEIVFDHIESRLAESKPTIRASQAADDNQSSLFEENQSGIGGNGEELTDGEAQNDPNK